MSEWPLGCWKKIFYFEVKETVALLGSSSHTINISLLCGYLFFMVISIFMWFCRFCSEKSPEAIRILLPDETSPAVSPVKVTMRK